MKNSKHLQLLLDAIEKDDALEIASLISNHDNFISVFKQDKVAWLFMTPQMARRVIDAIYSVENNYDMISFMLDLYKCSNGKLPKLKITSEHTREYGCLHVDKLLSKLTNMGKAGMISRIKVKSHILHTERKPKGKLKGKPKENHYQIRVSPKNSDDNFSDIPFGSDPIVSDEYIEDDSEVNSSNTKTYYV